MNDDQLLKYYISLRDPEAGPWNLSPQNLYLEMMSRDFALRNIELFTGIKICNIGIGTGEWDDYLGYISQGYGKVMSIDIDQDICAIMKYRQKRERHPNPSEVLCEDIRSTTLQGDSFHYVTLIGSTMNEIDQYEETLETCFRLLKDDGMLIYMDFEKYHTLDLFENWISVTDHELVTYERFDRYANVASYAVKARKRYRV